MPIAARNTNETNESIPDPADHPSQWAAIRSVGKTLGCSVEAPRRRVRLAERDTGRPGLTTDEQVFSISGGLSDSKRA
jgi:hypothetical protein